MRHNFNLPYTAVLAALIAALLMLLFLANPAKAASLDSLLAGGSLSSGDVTVSDFTYTGSPTAGVNVSIVDFTPSHQLLEWSWDDLDAAPGESIMVSGTYSVTVADPALLTGIGLGFISALFPGDSVVWANIMTPEGRDSVTTDGQTVSGQRFAAGVPKSIVEWSANVAAGPSHPAGLGGLRHSLPTGVVPLPASLPLAAFGLSTLLWVRRRAS